MKKLTLTFLIMLLLVSSISALDFTIDNYKEFNKLKSDYGTVEIWDKGQIGDDKKLVEHTLLKNTDECLVNCEAEGESTLYYDGRLFTDLEFADIKGDREILSKSNIFIYETEDYVEEVCERERNCVAVPSANQSGDECTWKKINCQNVTKQRGEWVKYGGEVLDSGTYQWKIKANKNRKQNIDWIAESHGMKFEEWAWWNSSWDKKREINFTGARTEDLTNFTVFLELNDVDYIQTDGDDLRFLNASETGELNYDIDYINSSSIGVWIQITNLTSASNENTTIFAYFNNSGATSGEDKQNTWTNAVGSWHMNNNANPLNDSSVQANNFTSVTNVGLNTSGVFHNQIEFNTATSTMNTQNDINIDGFPYEITLVGWIFLNSTQDGFLFQFGTGPTTSIVLGMDSTNWRIDSSTAANGNAVVTGNHHFAFTSDATNQRLFIDGVLAVNHNDATTLNNQSFYAGSTDAPNQYKVFNLDQLVIYEEEKSSAWLNRSRQLNNTNFYSIGASQNFTVPGVEITTRLNNPETNLVTVNSSIVFEGNFSTNIEANLTNATLFVWHSNGSELLTNFTTLTGITNQSQRTGNNISPADNYEWNFLGCSSNGTLHNCSFASTNRTFNTTIFNINAETFSATALEGSSEEFILNITIGAAQAVINATLHYNNTANQGTIDSSNSPEIILSRTVTTPNVGGTTNVSFFWEVQLGSGDSQNTTPQNQTIQELGIDDCGAFTTLILNYSLFDEETQTFLNTSEENTTIELDIAIGPVGSGETTSNFSQNYTDVNPALVCTNIALNTSGFRMDVLAKYQSDGRALEYHNLQNVTLSNNTIPQVISLFDLLSTDATLFLITFKDVDFLPVNDALISINRQYVGEGVFKAVEIPITDINGQTRASFDTNNIIYTLVVTKNGEVLATFDNIAVFCENAVVGDCTLNLNAFTSGTQYTDFQTTDNLNYAITFNETSRVVTTTFSTIDGTTVLMFMNTTRYDTYGNATVCTDTLLSSSGTLTCTVPAGFGNVTVLSQLFKDNGFVTQRTFQITQDAISALEGQGTILALILMLTIPFFMITNVIGFIIGAIIALVVASLLIVVDTGGILGPASVLIWAFLTGGIIIWKMIKKI